MAPPLALTWSAPALDDLDEIAAYIALDKPRAAEAVVRRVLAAVERLREHPASGRRVPELPKKTPYREVIVPPCRIVYRREDNTIFIVYVVRGERQLRRERLR